MKYYLDGKEVKRANTINQRVKLLNKNNKGNIYKIINHFYYGYAILENDIKIFETMNEDYFHSMLGKLCINNGLMDNYSNILI